MLQKRPKTYRVIYLLGRASAYSPLLLRIILGHVIFLLWLIIPDLYKKNASRNLKLFFPQLGFFSRIVFIATNLYNFVHTILDIVSMWFRGKDWAYTRIKKVHNEHLLDESNNNEHGVIFVSPHLGNWELLGAYLTRSHNCLTMYKISPNPYYDKLSTQYRQSCGIKTIEVKDTFSMRHILKALKQGGNNGLILLPDQKPLPNSGSEMIEFYGVKIPTNSLLYKITQATGSRVLFIYSVRKKWGRYEIFIEKPEQNIFDNDIKVAMRAMNHSIEKCVDNAPAHYNWLYDKYQGAIKHSA